MKTKKIVSVIIVLALTLTLVACGADNTTGEGTPSGASTQTDVSSKVDTVGKADVNIDTADKDASAKENTQDTVAADTAVSGETAVNVPVEEENAGDVQQEETPAQRVPSVSPAKEAYVVEDAEGRTASDLADDWSVKKYADNWVDCGASIGIAESFDAAEGNSFVLNCWNNYTTFRYSRSYKVTEGYNAISFYAKGDRIADIKLQLMSSEYGVYATCDLGKLPDRWAAYVVSMTDPAWKISMGGASAAFADVLDDMGLCEFYELIPYFDMINIILSGVTENGANTHIYFDDLCFVYGEGISTAATELALADVLTMNFDEVNGWGEAYPSKAWIRSKYVGSGWQEFETGINDYNSSKAGSKLLGLTTGWGTNFMYRYVGNGAGLGMFEHFSVDLGTYNSTKAMKVKIAVVTEDGRTIYMMGSADSMNELQPAAAMQNFTFDFAELTAVKEFYFCVYSPDQNGDHLFIDNIKLY